MWVQAADEEYSAGVLDQDEGDEDDLQVRESRSEDAGLLQLDEKITQAMANMDYPPQWKNTDSQQREGNETGSESLSHELQSCRFLLVRGKFVDSLVRPALSLMLSDTFMLRSINDYDFKNQTSLNQTKHTQEVCGFILVSHLLLLCGSSSGVKCQGFHSAMNANVYFAACPMLAGIGPSPPATPKG